MHPKRAVALATTLVLLTAGGVAVAVTAGGGEEVASTEPPGAEVPEEGESTTSRPPRTSTSTAPSTTEPSTTTTAEPTPPPPAGPDDLLRSGSHGPEVEAVQRRLTELRFDPGPVDGNFGLNTLYAVQGFQKTQGQSPDGVVGPMVRAALAAPAPVVPFVPNGGAERVEIDLQRQLLFVYEGGALRLVTHTSTGSGERFCVDGSCSTATTPEGSHRFLWRWPGWRTSRLGRLYNPVYFTSWGIAVHGSLSVPTHPASHGCVRIPMLVAEYFPDLVSQGDAVYVIDGAPPTVPAPPPPAVPPPPPPDPPAPPPPPPPPTTVPTTVPPTTAPPTTGSTTSTTRP